MLTHFARWLPKSRAKCRITLRDKLYESLGESDLLHESARSAAETLNFSPKYATKSLEIAIFADMRNLVAAQTFSYKFLEHLGYSTTCIWYRTRSTNNLSQNELVQLELCSKMSPNILNNFDPMLIHFARWLPKSRATCRITLETSSTSHLENPICWATMRAAQRKHEILDQNMPPNRSKSQFSLIYKILG